MTGRGFSFKATVKKTEEDESDAASSIAPSTASNFLLSGRGRGISFPSLLQKPKDDAKSEVSTFSLGIGRGITAGRGMFASIRPPPSVVSSEETKLSSDQHGGSGTSPVKQQSVSSGIIAGRGTSGRGTGTATGTGSGRGSSGYAARDSPTVASVEDRKADSPAASTSSGAVPKTSPAKVTEVAEVDKPTVKMHGNKGKEFSAMTNSIELNCDPNAGVFEYEVRFTPGVDNMSFRAKYLSQHRDFLGVARTFDGVILFLPKRLPDEITRLVSESPVDNSKINVDIIFKRKKRLGECVQLYNILFEKIFHVLRYLRVGRKMFDPTAPKMVSRHKLEVWPGYVKSVDIQEKGLMLTLDVSHRVLSTRSILEFMVEVYKSSRDKYQENIKKALIGHIVLTRYNNKTYRVDDVVFDKSPKDTFHQGDSEISYIDYYKKQYNIEIKDANQLLLISRKEVRVSGEKEKREYVFCLVPELCFMTGLTDDMRSNFTVMKDLASHTKLSPFHRVLSFKKFIENVNTTPAAKEILSNWGLTLESEPLKLTARLFDQEKIVFGRGRDFPAGPQADFSRHATSNEVLEPIDLMNWLLVYVKTDISAAKAFEETILKVCGPTGMRVTAPRHVALPNDRTETFINAIRKEVTDPKIQIVVIIFPTLRDDRYVAVKRVLCAELPVPSQCINSKTLKNETKNRSIVQKIILQMNCKMGGTLWSVRIPLSKTMICGIDTYHEAGHKGITVGGFVASINPEFTRWYSKPTIQEKREELVNGLTASMESALLAYKSFNSCFPDRIILYRDGVGDGQLQFVENYELPQFKAAFERVAPGYSPGLTFIIVQKRINTKFFMQTSKPGADSLANPPPGSVLDHTITSRTLFDFYLISQHVREGTTTPSHYIVLSDDNKFDADILQRLTYKLCFLYYNWPGTVRVPAPCQYAHKLADLVGTSIKRQVAEKLADKLFFL